jgi:hypothetical protein
MHKFKWSILVVGVLLAGPASAHSGGLNKDGCHTNRKTGDYHCHRPQSAALPYRAGTADDIRPAYPGPP